MVLVGYQNVPGSQVTMHNIFPSQVFHALQQIIFNLQVTFSK
jgi:hypothetical protein